MRSRIPALAVLLAAALAVVLSFRPDASPRAPAARAPAAEPTPALASPEPHAVEPPAPAASSAAPPIAPSPPAVRRPAPAMDASNLTEAEIMQDLHDLGMSDPAYSLKLAREGNARFKDSPEAPERASIIVRSLATMGRSDEAIEAAREMERDYPDSDWTRDVHRHMLVNPPTHPSERGYGRRFELP